MPETKNIESLYAELNELKSRLRETQDTLDAIRNGEVDAIIVTGQNGDKVFSLASSETPYRIILEEMDEGALTVSSRGIIFYSNQRFSDLISVKLEKVIGSDFASFISEEDKPEFKRLLRTALRRSIRGVVTSTVNNKTIHLQLSLTHLPGNMEGEVCIVVSDITELTNYQNYLQEIVDERTEKLKIVNRQLSADIIRLKKAEKALQRSDERYSLATTAANLGTWEHIYGESGWKIIWSEQMYNIFGLDQGMHLDNESFTKIIHPLDLERVTREYRNIVEKRSPYDIEYRIIRPDNSVKWVHLTGRVIYKEESGEGLRINGIARDITKRKEAEIRIRESEAKYRLLSDTMTQGVIYSDADGKILSVNPAAERIIGKNAEDIALY